MLKNLKNGGIHWHKISIKAINWKREWCKYFTSNSNPANQTSLDSVLKEKLTQRALQSEKDITSSRLLDKESVIKKTNDYFAKWL